MLTFQLLQPLTHTSLPAHFYLGYLNPKVTSNGISNAIEAQEVDPRDQLSAIETYQATNNAYRHYRHDHKATRIAML